MRRLIDANLLKENCKIKGEFINNFQCVDLVTLGNVIDAQPTAFDIEKVMKFLEEREQLTYKRYMDTPSNSPCYVRYQTQYYERKQILDFMKGLLDENK